MAHALAVSRWTLRLADGKASWEMMVQSQNQLEVDFRAKHQRHRIRMSPEGVSVRGGEQLLSS